MKKFLALLYIIISTYTSILSTSPLCPTSCSISKNLWLPRSFASYGSHDLLQEKYVFVDNLTMKENSVYFSFVSEFMQNFGAKCNNICQNLGSLPFWSGTNTLTIGNNDGRAQFDAYQLGMGNVITDADGIAGIIQLNPKVQHVGCDIMMYYMQYKDRPSVYFKIHAPLGAMIINPNLQELRRAFPDDNLSFTQKTADPASSTIVYQWEQYPSPARREQSVAQAFFGGVYDQKILVGNIAKPIRLRKGRISPARQTTIRLGDLSASLGYNFIARENGFLGIAFKVSCPTGNVPAADYMLEPIFGRAGAWAIGAETTGFYTYWQNETGTKTINLYGHAELLHLFPGRRPNFRTFDLKKNGPGSKYLLVQNYVAAYSADLNPATPTTQVTEDDKLQPAANVTTLPVISSIAAEGCISGMIDYTSNNWSVALGAELWARSSEKLSIDFVSAVNIRFQNLNDFAVIGRQVSRYRIDGQGHPLSDPGNPDSGTIPCYCEPLATICKSQDPVQLVGSVTTVSLPSTLPDGIADARISSNRISADVNEALDIAGAQASAAWTGRLFGQCSYTWRQLYHEPALAFIIGSEFTNNTNNAVQLWSCGIRGSINF